MSCIERESKHEKSGETTLRDQERPRKMGRKSAREAGMTTNKSVGIIRFYCRAELEHPAKSWQDRRVSGNAPRGELGPLNRARGTTRGGQSRSCTCPPQPVSHLQVFREATLLPRTSLFQRGIPRKQRKSRRREAVSLEFKQTMQQLLSSEPAEIQLG